MDHTLIERSDAKASQPAHLSVFDPFRGLLALWVIIGHVAQRCGGSDWANRYAVDNFMFVSGFLMFYIWNERSRKPVTLRNVCHFFVRRFFRIAPLYYLAFSLTLIFSYDLTVAFQGTFYKTGLPWDPQPWLRGPPPEIHSAPINWFDTIAHYSFVFGLFPSTGASSWLPDWSIGLEMQFYVIVPFLVIALRGSAVSVLMSTLVALCLVYVNDKLFGVYLNNTGLLGVAYGQPSLLTFKLHLFLAGALVALSYIRREGKAVAAALVCFIVIIAAQPKYVSVPIFALVILLVAMPRLPRRMTKMFSTSPAKFMGDTSYAAYLCHQPILIAICYLLVQNQWWLDLQPSIRLLTAMALILPVTYLFAYAAFRLVEMPMIKVGRRISGARSRV